MRERKLREPCTLAQNLEEPKFGALVQCPVPLLALDLLLFNKCKDCSPKTVTIKKHHGVIEIHTKGPGSRSGPLSSHLTPEPQCFYR